MDGLSRAIGAGAPVSLAGETYMLAPMTLEVIGIVENYLLLKRATPSELIGDLLETIQDGKTRQHLLANAAREFANDPLRRIVTNDEFQKYIDTDAGVELTAWLCLRDTEREAFARLGAVRQAIKESSEDEVTEFIKTRNHVSGISQLCLLDWPREEDKIPAAALERRRRRRDQEGYHRANWRLNFNRIAKGFTAVTFDDIKHMTLYQYRMMCVDEKELTQRETVEVDRKDFDKVVKQKIVHIGGRGSPSAEELVRIGVARELDADEQAMMQAAAAANRQAKAQGNA